MSAGSSISVKTKRALILLVPCGKKVCVSIEECGEGHRNRTVFIENPYLGEFCRSFDFLNSVLTKNLEIISSFF
jgi:hypothetical protein